MALAQADTQSAACNREIDLHYRRAGGVTLARNAQTGTGGPFTGVARYNESGPAGGQAAFNRVRSHYRILATGERASNPVYFMLTVSPAISGVREFDEFDELVRIAGESKIESRIRWPTRRRRPASELAALPLLDVPVGPERVRFIKQPMLARPLSIGPLWNEIPSRSCTRA